MANPIETAPKDRRILGYGKIGFESLPGWGTVIWDDHYKEWNADPCEATEYSPEACELTHWAELPDVPA